MSKLQRGALVNSDNIQSIVITLRLFYHGNEVKVPVPLAEHEANPGHDAQAQLDPGVPDHVHEGGLTSGAEMPDVWDPLVSFVWGS